MEVFVEVFMELIVEVFVELFVEAFMEVFMELLMDVHGLFPDVPGCSRIILELFSMFSNCFEKVLTNTEVYDSLIKVVQTMPKTVGAKILKIIA